MKNKIFIPLLFLFYFDFTIAQDFTKEEELINDYQNFLFGSAKIFDSLITKSFTDPNNSSFPLWMIYEKLFSEFQYFYDKLIDLDNKVISASNPKNFEYNYKAFDDKSPSGLFNRYFRLKQAAAEMIMVIQKMMIDIDKKILKNETPPPPPPIEYGGNQNPQLLQQPGSETDSVIEDDNNKISIGGVTDIETISKELKSKNNPFVISFPERQK